MLANIRSAIDIAIVSFIIYRILVLLVGRRAIQLIKGVFILMLISVLAIVLRFRLLSWFLSHTLWALSFAVPIVFQPELRSMLEELGKGKLGIFKQKQISHEEAEPRINQITGALKYLKANKIGALLVFQEEDSLEEYTQTAIPLNSRITQELLITIFWEGTPLHDGAVVLDRYNLVAGGCYLPLADAPELSRWYGTRHRAALGISEKTDALVFVVSEERGEVSIARHNTLKKDVKNSEIESELWKYFAGEQQIKTWKTRLNDLKEIFWVNKPEQEAGGLVQ